MFYQNLEVALTYDDVQLVPQYSEIASRSDISLTTRYTKNYTLDAPYMASCMDTICERVMAITMMSLGATGCIHRFMTVEKQCDEVRSVAIHNHKMRMPITAAIGASEADIERGMKLIDAGANVLLIDVAHGNHINVVRTLENLRDYATVNKVDIIAGSVAEGYGAVRLAEAGADAIRVGIGNGCFTPNMEVVTDRGLVSISDVQIGDRVWTHKGRLRKVINTFEYERDEEIVEVNGIECTTNHEFYVVHVSDVDCVTDSNIHEYAKWVPAGELTDEFLLVEL